MRKFLMILLFLLCAASVCFADAALIGEESTTTPGEAPDYCSDMGASGTYLFWWNGDYSGNPLTACYNNGAGTKNGSLGGGAAINTWAGFGISGPSGGPAHGVEVLTTGDFLSFVVSSGDIVNTSEGTIALDIYISSNVSTGSTFAQVGTGDNEITATIAGSDDMYLKHKGISTAVVSMNGGVAVATGQWKSLRIAWSVTSNQIATKIDGGSWINDSDVDTVTEFGVAATLLSIGDGPSGNGISEALYITDFRASATYKDDSL